MPKYTNTDLYFSDDGDFILSTNKDLYSTIGDPNRSLIQGIRSRLNFRGGEWPGRGDTLGANITDFIGKNNTAEIGEQIKLRVISELTSGGFISANDLLVDIVPISKTQLLVLLKVRTIGGLFEYRTQFSLREEYDSMNKGIT